MSTAIRSAPTDRVFFLFNAVVSAAAIGVLSWLLVFRHTSGGTADLRFLPPLNACLNVVAATLLVAGRVAIARRRVDVHRFLMVGAFTASSLFLVGYLAYHAAHGDTRFGGVGVVRVMYLLLLASHVVLSVPVVPLALAAFYFAAQRRFDLHRRVTRVLHPIWLYVSVTGVLVYLFLRPYYPA